MKERKTPPPVTARQAGHVGEQLELLAKRYRERFPDRDVRFIYAPEHKTVNSKFLVRQAQGYEPVTYEELGMEGKGFVRVGDALLVSIPAAQRMQLIRQANDAAKAELEKVESSYYRAIDEIDVTTRSGERTRAVGRAIVEFTEREIDVKQREEE